MQQVDQITIESVDRLMLKHNASEHIYHESFAFERQTFNINIKLNQSKVQLAIKCYTM